ncbi:DUF6186 family protein [uncultured Microbacterium sp.]|uniref:DUF6186 family protein n=1 Tax=uncultured Microbacterium sp. TaxID=191216 RepID=UPI00262447B2|nr:DUF6186 family protein [uncultured Microbacterium sp.]
MIVSTAFFLLCAAALVLASWRIHLSDPEATVTALFDRLLTDRSVRLAVLVVWWWLGWHFLAGQTL